MRAIVLAAALLVPLVGAGCGGGSDADPPPDDDDPTLPEGYSRLVARTWTIQPGDEDIYKCVRVTIPEDTYVTSFIAEAPQGTHHTVLSIADGAMGTSGPDGEQECTANTLGTEMLYASGVGTSPLDFPADVGIKIAAGTQVHLNLHLFNATEAPLEGKSGILIAKSSTPPPILAEMVFAGKFPFTIPHNDDPQHVAEITGHCVLDADYTVFALWPHMHQTAIAQQVDITHGGNTVRVLDTPYAFAEQKYFPQSPMLELSRGDAVDVTCQYINNTGSDIEFGDSSNDEMCFSGLYRFPANGSNLFGCTELGL
jgi:hypothetical protein